MDFPGFIATVVLGGISGWVAAKLVEGHGLGVIGNIVVGIIGALLGSWVFNVFGAQGVTGFNLWSFVVAVVGAVILLWLVNLFTNRRK